MTAQQLRLEHLVARVLSVGLRVSVALLALGLALTLIASATVVADRLLTGGLIVLLATPVARVVVSAGSYAVEGDWKYFFITLAVLAVLAVSVITALNIG